MVRKFDARVVTGTTPTSTGTVDFTAPGVGAQPKGAMIIVGLTDGVNDYEDGFSMSWGVTDGTDDYCTSASDHDNAGTSDSSNYASDVRSVALMHPRGGTTLVEAVFDSWVDDGIRLDFTKVDTTAWRVIVHLFFGTDCECATWKMDTILASDASETVTVGFKPTFVLTSGAFQNFNENGAAHMRFQPGIASEEITDESSSVFAGARDAQATSSTRQMATTKLAQTFSASWSAGRHLKANTYTSTGFDIQSSVGALLADPPRICGMAVKAADLDSDQRNNQEKDTPPAVVTYTTGWKPGYVYALGSGVDNSTLKNHFNIGIYGTDFQNNHGLWGHGRNSVGTTRTGTRYHDNGFIVIYNSSTGQNLHMLAQANNRTATGFDLDWTTAVLERRFQMFIVEEAPFETTSAAITLPSIESASTGLFSQFAGSADVTLPSIESAADADLIFETDSAALTLPSIESATDADLIFDTATAAVTLPSLQSVSDTDLVFDTDTAVSLPAIQSASDADLIFDTDTAVNLPAIESATDADLVFDTATAAVTLPSLQSASTSQEIFETTVSLVLPSLESIAGGTVAQDDVTASSALVLPSLQSLINAEAYIPFLGIGPDSCFLVLGPQGGTFTPLGPCGGTFQMPGPHGGTFRLLGPQGGTFTPLGPCGGTFKVLGTCGGTLKILPQWNVEVAIISDAHGRIVLATGTLDNCKRLIQDICVVRGDRRSLEFTFVDDSGTAIDFTGFTAKLVVDPEAGPDDTTNNLFTITGVIAAPTTGVIVFTPSAADALQTPDTYFYDVQVTDSGGLPTTVARGEWVVEADVADAGV